MSRKLWCMISSLKLPGVGKWLVEWVVVGDGEIRYVVGDGEIR